MQSLAETPGCSLLASSAIAGPGPVSQMCVCGGEGGRDGDKGERTHCRGCTADSRSQEERSGMFASPHTGTNIRERVYISLPSQAQRSAPLVRDCWESAAVGRKELSWDSDLHSI